MLNDYQQQQSLALNEMSRNLADMSRRGHGGEPLMRARLGAGWIVTIKLIACQQAGPGSERAHCI